MNDDLKAYVDGELPPDAAERLRAALERDPALAHEADALRRLSLSLRRLPEPEPVGQAATLAALGRRREPIFRGWGLALAGCAAVALVAALASNVRVGPRIVPAANVRSVEPVPVEVSIPAVRRNAFTRFVQKRGGEIHRDALGLRAVYPSSLHIELLQRFELPKETPWAAEGLRVRLEP